MATNPPKVHYQYGTRDFYKLYKKRTNKTDIVPYKVYRDFLRDFFAEVIKKIVIEKWTFYIPHRLGFIMTKSQQKEISEQPVDYHNSRLKKKKILFTNDRTYQKVYSFRWITKRISFNNKKYYKFRPIGGSLAKRSGAGKHALKNHIMEVTKDPYKKLLG